MTTDRWTADRWVLVTGGAQRLGRELCLAFARSGWHIACHYLHSDAQARITQGLVQELGQQCVLICADLGQSSAPEDLLLAVEQHAGALPTCIVNNASIFEADQALTCTPETALQHFQINTLTPMLLANALARRLQSSTPVTAAAGAHCVIHVLDQKVHNLNPDYFSYTVSKLALERSVALQAQALAPAVRVCGLSPGLMYLSGPQTPDNFATAARINLLRRPIYPAHVAATAVVLAENLSLNGCTLQADNGQHLVPLSRDVMFAIEPHTPL